MFKKLWELCKNTTLLVLGKYAVHFGFSRSDICYPDRGLYHVVFIFRWAAVVD